MENSACSRCTSRPVHSRKSADWTYWIQSSRLLWTKIKKWECISIYMTCCLMKKFCPLVCIHNLCFYRIIFIHFIVSIILVPWVQIDTSIIFTSILTFTSVNWQNSWIIAVPNFKKNYHFKIWLNSVYTHCKSIYQIISFISQTTIFKLSWFISCGFIQTCEYWFIRTLRCKIICSLWP